MSDSAGYLMLRPPNLKGNSLAKIWLNRVVLHLNSLDFDCLFSDNFDHHNGIRFLDILERGLKNIFDENDAYLLNLSAGGFALKLYRCFYELLEGPDLNSLREEQVLTLVGVDEIENCRPAQGERIFPWLTGKKNNCSRQSVCVLFGGCMYRRLFVDLLTGLKDTLPDFSLVLPSPAEEYAGELNVELLYDKSPQFVPEYLWIWGDAPSLQARAIEWLGKTTIVAPAQKSWYKILPKKQHEFLYPPHQPWLGLQVFERLVNRSKERKELLQAADKHVKNNFLPDNIFENKIIT